MAAIHQVPCLCAECEQICKGKLEERERRLVSAKKQRKRHEVENDRHHITSMDQAAQGTLADSHSEAIEDQLIQRQQSTPSAHIDSG